ncbi:MAG: hypothetical protein ACSHYB_12060 [Roseibacillus sp.]
MTEPTPGPLLYEGFSTKGLWISLLAPPFLTILLLFLSTKIQSSAFSDWTGVILLLSIFICWGYFGRNLSKRLRGRQMTLCAIGYPFVEVLFCLSAGSYGCLAFSISN